MRNFLFGKLNNAAFFKAPNGSKQHFGVHRNIIHITVILLIYKCKIGAIHGSLGQIKYSSLQKYLYLILGRLTFSYLVFRLTVLAEDCKGLCLYRVDILGICTLKACARLKGPSHISCTSRTRLEMNEPTESRKCKHKCI